MNNMKTIAILLLLASLSGCFSTPDKEKTGLEGKPLPSFDLLLTDSVSHFNTNRIPPGEPVVLFYFGPHCPYSRAQMEDIVDNIKTLGNIRFYVFTSGPFQELKGFYDHYGLKNYPNVTVGQDYAYYFSGYFKTNIVPYLAVYDRHKQLKQALIGKTDIGIIKDIALE